MKVDNLRSAQVKILCLVVEKMDKQVDHLDSTHVECDDLALQHSYMALIGDHMTVELQIPLHHPSPVFMFG